jgi:hypothetical protein
MPHDRNRRNGRNVDRSLAQGAVMTPRQIAEQASNIRSGFGIGRDFAPDPRTATPEHECPVCENILSEGEICNCQAEDDEPASVWDYLNDLSPAERRREEAEIRLERNGMGEWL